MILFLAAGLAGGAVNAAAGGAKLFVFPMLLAAGLPPVAALATATVALWPSQFVAIYVYRDVLRPLMRSAALRFLMALIGGLAGALLLLWSGDSGLMAVVPALLALATLAIALGKRIRSLVPRGAALRRDGAVSLGLILAVSVYGGYFGAAMGFMLLAALTLAGSDRLTEANALKNLLAATINTVAVIPLALSGVVDWVAASTVLVGGLLGGYVGARVVEMVPEPVVRGAIVVLGVVLTIRFLLIA